MKTFNVGLRERQLELLSDRDSRERLNKSSQYTIEINFKVVDSAHCAGTIEMLLSTKYKKINVYIKKVV